MMRNSIRAIFLLMCSLAIAVGLVYADLKKGYYAPAQLGSMRQAAPIELLPDSNYQVPAFPAPAVDLAPGDGLQDVRIYCNTCHGPRYITMQPPLPAATWESEVNKMNKSFGAGIPEENTRNIIRYLQAHYTVENRKE
jgi:mono/diheme cytochrome c family protein